MSETTNYIVDNLKLSSGKCVLPVSVLEAIKVSSDDSSKSLKEILEIHKFPLDYELYSFKINLNTANPLLRVIYFDDAEGRRRAYWDYTNGYFNYGDWAHAFFIRNSFPCMVKYDGTIDYKLDPYDYTLKEDGSKSDIDNTDYEGSAMVAFPTIWIKRWSDDNYLYVSICDKQLDEDYHAYMHTNKKGQVCKYKFIGLYFSALFTDRYKSLCNQKYSISHTFSEDLQYIHANGDNWEMFSWSDFATIGDLLTLISGSDNSQTAFGYGLVNNGTTQPTTNGSNTYGGAFYNSAALNTNSNTKIMYIQDLYGVAHTWLAGAIYLNGKFFVKPYPEYNTTGDGYENLDITISGTSDAYIKVSTVNQYGRFPTKLGGTATTYECDTVAYSNSIVAIAKTRSVYNSTTKAGKMALLLNSTSAANAATTSRLTCFSVE